MADSLFHFIFPIIAMLAARPKIKHRITTIVLFAFIASFVIDLDHFGPFVARGTFHNIFVTLLIPVILIILSFIYEEKGTYYKNLSITLLLVLFSHPILDLFDEGGVKLFYPISDKNYILTGFNIPSPVSINVPGITAYILTASGIGLTIYFLMLLSIIFVEDFITVFKKIKEPNKAFLKTLQKEEKEIKKEL